MQNLHVGQLAVSQAPSFPFRWTGRGDWALRNRMNMRVSLDRATMGVAELFGGHSFKKILPPADYADEHPEYYALVNGQRKRSTSPGHGDQYCTWNRETGKVVLRNMRTALDANPRARVVSLSPNDGLGFCECPRCLALDEPGPFTLLDAQRGREVPWETARSLLSRRMVLFYNRIADGLAQSHPQVLVKSFAYSLYAAPPADPNLRCSSNLMIQLCHGICHNHSLRDSGCEYNVGYRKFLDGWSASAQHLSIYEYYWKVAWLDLPWPILHTMRADIPTYHAKGVKLLYTQYGANDAGGFGPIYYIAARLLWDVDADVDALLDHFCRKAYGRGADAMLRYYRFWEEQMAESGVHASHSPPVDAILEVFTPENLDAARGLLDEAASVATRSRQRERIERVRLQWEWTTLASRYVRAIEGSLAGYSLRWSGASSTGAQALRRATTPLLSEMRQFLEAHGNDRVIRTQRNNYIARFLRPDFVADAVVETLHQGETGELDSAQWLRAAGARAGERSQGLPAHVCVWVYGSDFDTDGEKSEHDVFLVREDGEPLRIGGLAPPGENANRVNCCIGIPGVPTRHFRPAAATFAITNLPGDWSDSRLFAVYLMPPDLPASSREATFLVERHLDWVRSRSAGFFEFGLEGQRNKDGARALIDVPVIGFPTRPQPVPTIPAVRRYQPAVTLDAAGRGATLDHETAVLSVRADGQLAVGPLVSYRSSQCLLRRLGLASALGARFAGEDITCTALTVDKRSERPAVVARLEHARVRELRVAVDASQQGFALALSSHASSQPDDLFFPVIEMPASMCDAVLYPLADGTVREDSDILQAGGCVTLQDRWFAMRNLRSTDEGVLFILPCKSARLHVGSPQKRSRSVHAGVQWPRPQDTSRMTIRVIPYQGQKGYRRILLADGGT